MVVKEPVLRPEMGMSVNHEAIYNGGSLFEIVGLRKDQVELKGDYSGGTNPSSVGSQWYPLEGLFRYRKVCSLRKRIGGDCGQPNVHCGYPNCEPYVPYEYHYVEGVRVDF